MTTVRQMFALQELDIILDRVQDDENKTQNELNNGDGIGDSIEKGEDMCCAGSGVAYDVGSYDICVWPRRRSRGR